MVHAHILGVHCYRDEGVEVLPFHEVLLDLLLGEGYRLPLEVGHTVYPPGEKRYPLCQHQLQVSLRREALQYPVSVSFPVLGLLQAGHHRSRRADAVAGGVPAGYLFARLRIRSPGGVGHLISSHYCYAAPGFARLSSEDHHDSSAQLQKAPHSREVGYSSSTSSEGSTPSALPNLRIVENRGSTSFLSILTSCLGEIPAALASCSWVMNALTLCCLTLRPILITASIDILFPS